MRFDVKWTDWNWRQWCDWLTKAYLIWFIHFERNLLHYISHSVEESHHPCPAQSWCTCSFGQVPFPLQKFPKIRINLQDWMGGCSVQVPGKHKTSSLLTTKASQHYLHLQYLLEEPCTRSFKKLTFLMLLFFVVWNQLH